MSEMKTTYVESEERKAPAIIAFDNLYEKITELSNHLDNLEKRLNIVLHPAIHNAQDNTAPKNAKEQEQASMLTSKLFVLSDEVATMIERVTLIDRYLEL